MEEKGRQGSKRQEFRWYHRKTADDEDDDEHDFWGQEIQNTIDARLLSREIRGRKEP